VSTLAPLRGLLRLPAPGPVTFAGLGLGLLVPLVLRPRTPDLVFAGGVS
jgi:hypothetical protein